MPRTEQGVRRDYDAADLLREMREARHLTREEMPREMRKAGIRRDYIPCVKTLWRIEERGAIPRERIRFGLGEFFDVPVSTIWDAPRVRAAA